MTLPIRHLLTVAAILFGCAGFFVGLTYAPCFASLCVEEFYPAATRWHLASFYATLGVVGLALLLRASNGSARHVSESLIVRREIPILQTRISLGGVALVLWLAGMGFATAGFWTGTQLAFWSLRTVPLAWRDAQLRLAATGITGHLCDVVLGLLILPVGRNSIIAKAFVLSQSTLLYAHKILAYALTVVVLAHGAAYYTFVADYAAAKDASPRKSAFEIDNPTLTLAEAEQRGYYFFLTLPTGMVSFLLLLVIVFTSLPRQRRRHYNTFYHAHIICSVLIFVFASVHASTDFYFILPGLILWVLEWLWRLTRGSKGLSQTVTATLEDAQHGWYRLSFPADFGHTTTDSEKQDSALRHPLQSFYLNIPAISKVQNHAFTAARIGSNESGPIFLLQKAQVSGRKEKHSEKEWTWKLSKLLEDEIQGSVPQSLQVRVEGPYSPTEATPYESANHIICIVGGTGITRALSLARWWLHNDARARRYTLFWTVRHRETARLREWEELQVISDRREDDRFKIHLHVSSESGRLEIETTIRQTVDHDIPEEHNRCWLYASGPVGLLTAAGNACVNIRRDLKRSNIVLRPASLDFYVAKWEV